METPLPFPPGGRNTIFLILRSNARKDIPHFPLEGNRAARSGG